MYLLVPPLSHQGLKELPETITPAPVRRPQVHPGAISVVVLDSLTRLESYRDEWEDLIQEVSEPNVFYEPWMLLPSVQAFRKDQELFFLLVFAHSETNPADPPYLIGFLPLHRERKYKKLPVRILRPWNHLHSFLCTPLVRAGFEATFWKTLLNWLDNGYPRSGLLELEYLGSDGPVSEALDEILHERKLSFCETGRYERALLIQKEAGAEEYIQHTFSYGLRKETRRQRRRIQELGNLELEKLADPDELDEWIQEFLDLESKGWKGSEGTALGHRFSEQEYFRTVVREGFQRNQVMILRLRLDEKTLAIKFNFLSGEGSFAYKIAFDESYAKYSPGVMLEVDNIREVFSHPELQWMDSCAVPDHSMINRLWGERRTIRSVLISTKRFLGNQIVDLLPFVRWVKKKIKKCS